MQTKMVQNGFQIASPFEGCGPPIILWWTRDAQKRLWPRPFDPPLSWLSLCTVDGKNHWSLPVWTNVLVSEYAVRRIPHYPMFCWVFLGGKRVDKPLEQSLSCSFYLSMYFPFPCCLSLTSAISKPICYAFKLFFSNGRFHFNKPKFATHFKSSNRLGFPSEIHGNPPSNL